MNTRIFLLFSATFLSESLNWVGLLITLDYLQKEKYSSFEQSLVLMCSLILILILYPFVARFLAHSRPYRTLLFISALRVFYSALLIIGVNFCFLPLIIFSYVLSGLTYPFYFPALNALLPFFVNSAQLLRINAWNFNFINLARIVGAASSGAALAFANTLILSILAFAGHVLALWALRLALIQWKYARIPQLLSLPKNKEQEQDVTLPSLGVKSTYLQRLKENKFILLTLIPQLYLAGFNLFVVAISIQWGSSQFKSWLYAAEGLAIVGASFFAGPIHKIFSIGQILKISAAAIILAEIFQFFSVSTLAVLVSFMMLGCGVGLFTPTLVTAIQCRVPQKHMEECFGTKQTIDNLSMIGLLPLYGLLLDKLSYSFVFLLIGGTSLLLIKLLPLDHPAWEEAKIKV